MNQNLIIGPDDFDDNDDGEEEVEEFEPEPQPEANQKQSRKRSRKARILTVEDCLKALSAIPALVAMGYLGTAQANSLRATYQAILQQHRQGTSASSARVPPNLDLGQVLRDHPELAILLEPFLTDEQIESVMREGEEDDE